jgi:P4 family phage/plasmid primase-like protien
MPKQDIQAAMNYYVDMGLPIIPLCPAEEPTHNKTSPGHKKICKCPGKIPLIAGWQNRKETTPEHLESWMKQFEDMNIGLPTGEASGYLGIDIDGEEGEGLLLKMSNGDLPETWEFITGAGRRLLYRIPVGIPTKKVKQSGEGKHQECAILCTGQQTVLPPSTHYTGTKYEWLEGRSPYDLDCAMAPKWLIDMVRYDKPKIGNMNLTGQPTVVKYAADMIDIASEFDAEDFDVFIPEELTDLKVIEVKKQKAGSGSKQTTSETEQLLYQVLSEGNRDNSMTQIIGHFLSKPEFRSMPQEMFLNMMLQYNEQYCDPPIEQESITAKVNHFWEIEIQKSAMYKETENKKEWVASQVVQMLLNKLEESGRVVKYDKATYRYYYCNTHKGPWIEDTNEEIEGKVWEFIQDPVCGDESWGTQHKLTEAMAALELSLRAKGSSKRQLFDLNANKLDLAAHIVVDGKLLNWRTGEMLPWDTSFNSTVNFNVEYSPTADCPYWKAYMEEWLPNPKTRRVLQEFMGSCLLPEAAPEEKFIILAGGGSNGKSMFLKGMKQIFKDYSISLTPQKLAERFGPASLYNKLVNICSEIEGDGGYLKNTSQLKAIISGEPLTAENKGKDPFQFEPVANLLFSCNTVPKTKDKTLGWTRRQVIVPFDKTFKPNSVKAAEMERNMHLEIAGIFNWLIAGLKDIKLRGYFDMSDELIEAQAEFKAMNDATEGFVRDCLEIVSPEDLQEMAQTTRSNLGVSTTIINALYNMWCTYKYGDKAKQYSKSPMSFNQEMQTKNIDKTRGYCVYHRKPTLVFTHIKIKLNEHELIQTILDECVGQGVTEPGFWLYELAKKTLIEMDDIE